MHAIRAFLNISKQQHHLWWGIFASHKCPLKIHLSQLCRELFTVQLIFATALFKIFIWDCFLTKWRHKQFWISYNRNNVLDDVGSFTVGKIVFCFHKKAVDPQWVTFACNNAMLWNLFCINTHLASLPDTDQTSQTTHSHTARRHNAYQSPLEEAGRCEGSAFEQNLSPGI